MDLPKPSLANYSHSQVYKNILRGLVSGLDGGSANKNAIFLNTLWNTKL